MASKIIGFTLNEQTDVKEAIMKQGLYNGFGKIYDLPSIKYVMETKIGFSPKELGELFIEMGTKLKTISCNITDIKTAFVLRESEYDMGQELVLEMTYKELEGND